VSAASLHVVTKVDADAVGSTIHLPGSSLFYSSAEPLRSTLGIGTFRQSSLSSVMGCCHQILHMLDDMVHRVCGRQFTEIP